MKIILASASPRREELIKTICDKIVICPSNFDESSIQYNGDVVKYIKQLSYEKAKEVSERKEGIVIGCDTVVFFKDKVLEKPKDRKEARNFLKMLSGNIHYVYSGYTIIDKKNSYNKFNYCKTAVKFYTLSEEEIESYINTDEYIDKAGGYGIQGKGALLVEKIEGDYFNIVGLPISLLYRELKGMGVNL